MMKHETHGRNRICLLAMYHLQLGKSFKAISEIVKSHWKTVQSSLRRFRNHGFEGLFESQRSGAPRKINTIQGTVKLSKIVSKRAIFLDFRQQEVFECLRPKWI
ncbi:hypothetical protein [Candidatus Tisiphia endosymbiont of Neophilaenus lineatus]|uniref:hypothetical protein n=1 Tax=Candidatus Tisiphia endosymbiont of Neophilaenus lineatus TaxID=3139336 RepID=UPI0035CA1BBA